MTPFTIITTLRSISGTNDKLVFLKANTNPLFERAFTLAYSSEYTFGIKKIPSFTKEADSMSLTEALDIIEKSFCTNKVTGNSRSDLLSLILACVSPDDAEVVKMVIAGNFDCGINVKNANKCFAKPIPTFEVMLCAKQSQKTIDKLFSSSPTIIAQTKSDGMRVIASVNENGNVRYRSRNGKDITLPEKYNTFFSNYPNLVFDGELVVVNDDDTGYASRKVGNGIINSVRQGKASDEDANRIRFVLWDCIDYEAFMTNDCVIPYSSRFKTLSTVLAEEPTIWRLVETKIVENFEQAQEFYNKQIAAGEEGAILKNPKAPYKAGRADSQVKMKVEETLDLRVVAMLEGTGRNAGRLGAITCVDKSGNLQVNVGSGFSDEQRDEFWKNSILGEIVEVKYNEVIRANGRETLNLFLPIFVDLRNDKNDIDTVSL